jgi:hypothetical protein
MIPKKREASHRRAVLRLSDLDHSKSAVLNTLTSPASRRTYEYTKRLSTGTVRLALRPKGQHNARELQREVGQQRASSTSPGWRTNASGQPVAHGIRTILGGAGGDAVAAWRRANTGATDVQAH